MAGFRVGGGSGPRRPPASSGQVWENTDEIGPKKKKVLISERFKVQGLIYREWKNTRNGQSGRPCAHQTPGEAGLSQHYFHSARKGTRGWNPDSESAAGRTRQGRTEHSHYPGAGSTRSRADTRPDAPRVGQTPGGEHPEPSELGQLCTWSGTNTGQDAPRVEQTQGRVYRGRSRFGAVCAQSITNTRAGRGPAGRGEEGKGPRGPPTAHPRPTHGPPTAHPEQNRFGRGASRVQSTRGGAHSEHSSSGRGWGVARPAGRRKTLDRELLVLTHEIPQSLDPALPGLQHGGRAAVVLQLEHAGRLRRTQTAADLRTVGGAQCAGHQPPQFTFGVGGVRSREACESGRQRVNSGGRGAGRRFPGRSHTPPLLLPKSRKVRNACACPS